MSFVNNATMSRQRIIAKKITRFMKRKIISKNSGSTKIGKKRPQVRNIIVRKNNEQFQNNEQITERNNDKNKQQHDQSEESLVALDANRSLKSQNSSWYFSDKKFTDFQLCQPTHKALQSLEFQYMTHIQARSFPYLLRGRDLLGAAKTGSGKTLAYLIPCMQLLHRFEFRQKNGTGVIIIIPTRELAIQVFEVAKKLAKFHNKTVGLLIGGMNRRMESNKLQKGVNMLICTPGRLLDHLQNSKFIYHNLLSLVIDEADALLRQGFEEDLNNILNVLPTERQTMLFSATQTQKVDELARLSLKDPIYIGVDDNKQTSTVQNLQQGYIIIQSNLKFQLLFTFLTRHKDKKIMVFFSSCNSVKFHSDLLNYVDITVMDIHGKQKQQKRSTTFHQFIHAKSAILLCTDVAARGLDIPEVDWIVQYDPPLNTKQYIHRVGRTCRGSIASGKALLFLLPEQEKYLKYLQHAKVLLNQYEINPEQLISIQEEFRLLIDKNPYLHRTAITAYKSYLHAYTTYQFKQVFNVHNLDLSKVAASFGLLHAPFVELNVKLGGTKVKKNLNKNR